MTLRTLVLAAAAAATIASSAPAAQERSIARVLDSLDRVRAFHETAIAPDGQRLAWVEDISAADGTTAIYVRELPSGERRRISGENDNRAHKERGLAWSPDGHTLAYLSDADTPNQLQLFITDVNPTPPRVNAGFAQRRV